MRRPGLRSSSLTAVRLLDGASADRLHAEILARCMSLGNGPGPVADKVFRIGHLGDFSDGWLQRAGCGRTRAARPGDPFDAGVIGAALASLAGNAATTHETT